MHHTNTKAARLEDTVAATRRQFDQFKPKEPDPDLHRDLTHGWMLPTLLHLDDCLCGRWDYWRRCCERPGTLPAASIPHLDFLDLPHPATRRMLERSLDCIPRHGSWRTWGSWQYVAYFLDWLLFGLGHKGQSQAPREPDGCRGASDRLYQVFALDALLLWPHDYFGSLLAETSYGKGQGFYPTPHPICEFMTRMVCDDKRDMRAETVCDPCVGTGRMLLHASNHSLRLFGMDIDPVLCKATLVNGYCFAPWLVRPIPWLDGDLAALERLPKSDDPEFQRHIEHTAAHLSDKMVESAPPQAQSYLNGSEFDPDGQKRVAPLLKRRRRPSPDPTQGTLF